MKRFLHLQNTVARQDLKIVSGGSKYYILKKDLDNNEKNEIPLHQNTEHCDLFMENELNIHAYQNK